jgi:hypothetical protein
MVKFFIDDTEIAESPEGWEGLTTTLRFDRELKGLFTMMDVSLTFHADGYTLLKTAFDTYGYCYSMPFEIRQQNPAGNYLPVFTGIVYLKDIEWSEGIGSASAKCQIKDNSFFAKIFNNKNIKARPYVPTSKNGEVIDAAPYQLINFFRPSTGVYFAHAAGDRTDTGFLAYDVLKFFIDYVSDGTIDFISDSFGSGGDFEGTLLTSGYVVRFVNTGGITQSLFEENWPEISLSEVIAELNKLFNIGFVAGYDGGRPYFKVEAYNDLFPNTTLQSITGIDNIKRRTATEYLYSNVLVGSTDSMDDSALSFPGDIRFIGFKQEDYVIVSDCNIDRTLNLTNSWIIDTNIIEEIILNGQTTSTTAYDRTIFVIDSTLDTGVEWDAVQSNWLELPAPYFYNETYNSSNKTGRHLNGIPAPIAMYLGTNDNGFEARMSADDNTNGTIEPVEFNNEILDPSGNYDPAAYEYAAPVGGLYPFHVHLKFTLENFRASLGYRGMNVRWFVHLRVYDSGGFAGGILKQDVSIGNYSYSDPNRVADTIALDFSGTLNLTATDTVVVQLLKDSDADTSFVVKIGSYWETGDIVDAGGVFKTFDPGEYPVIRNSFSVPMTLTNFLALKAQPLGLIEFSTDPARYYYGWLEELKYRHFQDDGNATFTLISNENINR